MVKYKNFLQWWLLIVLISLGGYALCRYGVFDLIIETDITKITFIIIALFIGFSGKIGYEIFQLCKKGYGDYNITPILRWTDRLPVLGIIGTVIGLIYLFSSAEIGYSNTTIILKGMGTALYTTAAGLICKLLLDLQADNFIRCGENQCDDPLPLIV